MCFADFDHLIFGFFSHNVAPSRAGVLCGCSLHLHQDVIMLSRDVPSRSRREDANKSVVNLFSPFLISRETCPKHPTGSSFSFLTALIAASKGKHITTAQSISTRRNMLQLQKWCQFKSTYKKQVQQQERAAENQKRQKHTKPENRNEVLRPLGEREVEQPECLSLKGKKSGVKRPH